MGLVKKSRIEANTPQESEQSRKRAENRYAILRTLHLKPGQQRAALSRELGIRKTSVTNITAEAIQNGLLLEDDPKSTRTRLSINSSTCCVVVCRLGTREVESARVLLDGTVEGVRSFPYPDHATAGEILDVSEKSLRHQLRATKLRVLGVGFADIGIVDPVEGVTRLATHLPQWRNVEVRAELERRLKIGVHVDNDVRSQLWSVAWFHRHLSKAPTLLYMAVLEGVAGALLMDGKLIIGRNCMAGEFGHIHAGTEGRQCGCGKLDCLEAYCSIPAITGDIRRLRPKLQLPDEGHAIARLAARDEGVRAILRTAALRLAAAAAPIVAAIDPDALVFGSPSIEFARIMGDLVHLELQRERAGLGGSGVGLIHASADHESTLRGIGGLVIDRCFQRGTPALTPR